VARVLLGGLGVVLLVGVGVAALFWTRMEHVEYAVRQDYIVAGQKRAEAFAQVRAAENAIVEFTSVPEVVTTPAPVPAAAPTAEIDAAVPDLIAGVAPAASGEAVIDAEAVTVTAPAAAALQTNGPDDPARPEWIGQTSGLQGEVYRHIGYVGPYETAGECDREEPEEVRLAVRLYAEELLPIHFPGAEIDTALAYASLEQIAPTVSIYDETIDSPTLGPMIQRHLKVEFDGTVKRQIVAGYREAVVSRRLAFTGVYSGLALACLGAMFGYLRLDTATRGYYSGRLKAATGAFLLAAAATGAAVWQRL
jgi:hypothetical protein